MEVFDAPVITPEEEDKLWLSSVLSLTATISLGYLAESGAHQAAEYTLSMSQPSEHHLLGLQMLFRCQILRWRGFGVNLINSQRSIPLDNVLQ